MHARLVALDGGPDIDLDRAMVVVGRHPACDVRLDSLRISRHHCCMARDDGEVLVRDLGSTNGVRINGQRVETGRLRAGDELSIAHVRYRLDVGTDHDRPAASPTPADAAARPSDPPGFSPKSTPECCGGTYTPEDEDDVPDAGAWRVFPPSTEHRRESGDEPSKAPSPKSARLSGTDTNGFVE